MTSAGQPVWRPRFFSVQSSAASAAAPISIALAPPENRANAAVTAPQFCPATAPNPTNRTFHSRLPAVVSRRNGVSAVPAIPAGIEIRLRRIGTHRQ